MFMFALTYDDEGNATKHVRSRVSGHQTYCDKAVQGFKPGNSEFMNCEDCLGRLNVTGSYHG